MTSTLPASRAWARFDDLRAGTAVRCPAPDRILVAERPEEVLGVLAQVEEATDALGCWRRAGCGSGCSTCPTSSGQSGWRWSVRCGVGVPQT